MLLVLQLPVPSRHCRAAGAAAQHISSFLLLQHPAPLLAHIPQPQPPPLLRRGGSLRLHARRLACELPLSAARAQALREGDLWLQLSRLLHAPFLLPLLPLHPLLRPAVLRLQSSRPPLQLCHRPPPLPPPQHHASSGLSCFSPPRSRPQLRTPRQTRSWIPSSSLRCPLATPWSPSIRRLAQDVTQCRRRGYFWCLPLCAPSSVAYCPITSEGRKCQTRRFWLSYICQM